MTLGDKIKSLRKEQKLSQSKLAKLCNLNETSICHYESNKTKPSLTTLQKLATGLHCDFEELYELL